MTAPTYDLQDTWLRRLRPPTPQPAVRLVCLPHAGGSASAFFPLASRLPAAVDVLAVQYPGRQDRHADRPLENLHELADRIADALSTPTPTPYVLFGHSMGATLAFEVASRLERADAGPAMAPRSVLVSGRGAPSRQRVEITHRLGDDELIAATARLQGSHSALLSDPDLRAMALPALRADFVAIETYRYRPVPRLRAPIHALIGDADPKVDRAEAEAWAEHTGSGFALSVFPGGHFYLNAWPAELLAVIKAALGHASPTPIQ